MTLVYDSETGKFTGLIEGQRGQVDPIGNSRPRTQKICFQACIEGEADFYERKWYNLWELRVKGIKTGTFAVTPLSHRPVKKTANPTKQRR